jgi:hypothetical protein
LCVVETRDTIRHATDDKMAYAHCKLVTCDYKPTLKYVIIIAFPLQQWLHERASLLRYAYIACLVIS